MKLNQYNYKRYTGTFKNKFDSSFKQINKIIQAKNINDNEIRNFNIEITNLCFGEIQISVASKLKKRKPDMWLISLYQNVNIFFNSALGYLYNT